MKRWTGKIAVVTGASSGIGASICKELVKAGLIVVGFARHTTQIEKMSVKLLSEKGKLLSRFCDVTCEVSVKAAFEWVEVQFGGINILINNAGIIRCTMYLAQENEKDLLDVMNTNYNGTVHCLKTAYGLMKKHNCDGHIININSIAGKQPHVCTGIQTAPLVNAYVAASCAVVGMLEVVRQELNFLKNQKVKVSSITPSFVKSELLASGRYPDTENVYRRYNHLLPEDIAEAVIFILGTGPNVQINDIVVRCIGEPI